VLALALSCARYVNFAHSGQNRYRAGDFDGATYDAAASLVNNPGYVPAQNLLQDAFRAAGNRHNDRIRELTASAAQFKWDDIVNEYRALWNLNRTVRDLPSLPNRTLPGGFLVVPVQDYDLALGEATRNAAQGHYDAGAALAASSDEVDVQKRAALEFQTALGFVPGFKDAQARFDACKRAGTRRLAIIPFEDKSGTGATPSPWESKLNATLVNGAPTSSGAKVVAPSTAPGQPAVAPKTSLVNGVPMSSDANVIAPSTAPGQPPAVSKSSPTNGSSASPDASVIAPSTAPAQAPVVPKPFPVTSAPMPTGAKAIAPSNPPGQSPVVPKSPFGDLTDRITDDIVSQVMNDPQATQFLQIISRDRLEQVMREQQFEASGLVDQTTAVRLGVLLGAHDILTGRITQILYTPEKTVSRQAQQQATVVLRTETYKDSAGNDQQRNIEGQVTALVTIYDKTSSLSMAGSYSIVNVQTAAVEKTESFETRKDFAGEWATYTGDKRALGDYAGLCDRSELLAPTEAELVSQAATDLSHSLAAGLKTFLH